MNVRTFSPILLAATLLAAGWAGCATAGKPGLTGRYEVTAPKSPFYKYGPAQAFGADFALTRGKRVTVTEYAFGYSRVTTDDGIAGFVATDDLTLAPPEPAPAVGPRQTARRARGGGGGDRYYTGPNRQSVPPQRLEGATPLFDVFDLPLPTDPDKPKPKAPAVEAPLPTRD